MSTLVFTGDIHAHNYELYSRVLASGLNSRLQHACACLQQAARWAAKSGTLIINGDLFHDRRYLSIDVLDLITQVICEIAAQTPIILNVGNHDQFLRNGARHSLRGLQGQEGVTVVPPHGMIKSFSAARAQVYLHPFTSDLVKIREFLQETTKLAQAREGGRAQILVLHQPVQTADLGQGVLSEQGLQQDDFDPAWDLVVLGHYHKPQQLFDRQIYYVGSPLQLDWNEAGDEKRFLLWRGGKVLSQPVEGLPRFQRLALEEYQKLVATDPEAAARDFLEVEVDDLEAARVLELPANVLTVPKPAVEQASLTLPKLTNFSPHEAVREWLASRDAEHFSETAFHRLV